MASYNWTNEKIFVSISTGMYARKLFIYISRGREFDADSFHKSMKPWLDKEKEEFREDDFPWGGIGCWNPVFPARADDMWLMAAVASKALVAAIDQKTDSRMLMVFEQQIDNNQFVGVKRIQ
jgi:hypothetical protein